MTYYIIVLGTAGSGKTLLTSALQHWLTSYGFDAAAVNLDPAAEWLPYRPDLDVRDYVDAREVMEKYKLGPNGTLLASIDLVAADIEEIVEELHGIRANYVIVDTPGQLEIFAFREAGPLIVGALTHGYKSASLFLIDSLFLEQPGNLVSALLLAASINVRLGLPQINVVSKADLAPPGSLEKLDRYLEDPDSLVQEIYSSRARILWGYEDLRVVIPRLMASNMIPVSSTTMQGIDNLYAELQRILAGGEDYLTEEPSPIL